ncbi:hypothetical protein PT2222_150269 [Paraburkholderia tropica]
MAIHEIDPEHAFTQAVEHRGRLGDECSMMIEGVADRLFRRALPDRDMAGEAALWRRRRDRLHDPCIAVDRTLECHDADLCLARR